MGGTERVGLTGGIGSGKSTVADMFSALGAMVIDADAISRQTTAPGGAAIARIAAGFGNSFITAEGALDRDRMRQLVFSDPSARQRLEAIIHPLVGAETQRRLATAQAPCVIFDIPLLVESGHWRTQLDTVVVVDCEEATQRRRVAARSGLSEAAITGILSSQARRSERLACADAVIYNENISLDLLEQEVRGLARRFGL